MDLQAGPVSDDRPRARVAHALCVVLPLPLAQQRLLPGAALLQGHHGRQAAPGALP